MEFTTLNTIIEDILKVVRGSIISTSEPISRRQIEDWVHQYRAELIRQDIDKGYYPNPAYIQSLHNLDLIDSQWEEYWMTDIEIPHAIDTRYDSGYRWVGTDNKLEYTLIPSSRAIWQQHKRYTPNEKVAFYHDNRMYVSKNGDLTPTPITIEGIFENPMIVMRIMNPLANKDEHYPFPVNKLPTLKDMIFKKELKIEIATPSDTTNDDKHNPKPNQ